MSYDPTDPTASSLCELFGLNPRQVRSLSLRLRPRVPVTVECELYVFNEDGNAQLAGTEIVTTHKRFRLEEITDATDIIRRSTHRNETP